MASRMLRKKWLAVGIGLACAAPAMAECTHGNWDAGEVDWPASVVSPGQMRFKCLTPGCREERTEEIPALGLKIPENGDAAILAAEAAVEDAEKRLFVAKNGSDETGNGSKSAPFATIQKAVDSVSNGGEILVMHGVYPIEATIALTENNKKSFSLASAAGDPRAVVIDAQHRVPAIYFSAVSTNDISGITVINGASPDGAFSAAAAGGITLDNKESTHLVVSNCVVAFCQSQTIAGGIRLVSPNNYDNPDAIDVTTSGILDTLVYGCTNNWTGNHNNGGGIIAERGNPNTRFERLRVVRCGAPAKAGGGLYIEAGRIKDSMFANNSGSLGGGVCLGSSSLTGCVWLDNCVFRDNTSTVNGGGLMLLSNFAQHSEGTNLKFYGNRCDNLGGALSLRACNMDWRNLVFEGNHANVGGAIVLENAFPMAPTIIENAVIRNNYASSYGGGVAIDHGEIEFDNPYIFRNLEISGNTSPLGAGIYVKKSHRNYIFSGVTIAGNRIPADKTQNFDGAGVYVNDSLMTNGAVRIENAAVWDNRNENPPAGKQWRELGYPVGNWDWQGAFTNFANCAVKDEWGLEVIPAETNLRGVQDMRFADAANGDYRPLRSSPLVNAGLTQPWMVEPKRTDLVGRQRVSGTAADIGAYEYQFVLGLMLMIR